MAKTNFTKVEEALAEGLRKMKVQELCELADIASGTKSKEPPDIEKLSHKYVILLRRLKINLQRLYSADKKIYHKLKVKKKELTEKLEKPENLNKEEWLMLIRLYKKSKSLIEELFPESTDEELIEKEQQKHINKRFNVNDKWLPLH